MSAPRTHQPQEKTAAQAEKLLRDPRLLDRIEHLMEERGLVGEKVNRRLVFLAGLGGHLRDPIHLVVKGESSGGKNTLLDKALEPLPPETLKKISGLSAQALAYHDGPIEGVLVIEEAAGQKHAEYSLRIAMSEGHVSRMTVNRERGGPHKGETHEVEISASIITTTTSPALHPENQTRVFDLWIDESKEQTRLVLERIGQEAREEQLDHPATTLELDVVREALRQLEPLHVVIPFAEKLARQFPTMCLRARRDLKRVFALIRVSALLRQKQRSRAQQGSVIASIDDYDAVYSVLQKVLEPSMSGLTEKALSLHDLHEELAGDGGWVWRADLEREAHQRGIASRNTVHGWATQFSSRGIWLGVMEGGSWKHCTIRNPREEPIQLPRPEDLEDLPGTPNSAAGTSNDHVSKQLRQSPSHDLRSSEALEPNNPAEPLDASYWEVPATRCDKGGNGSQHPNRDILGGAVKKCWWRA